jgi:hypothetical protein
MVDFDLGAFFHFYAICHKMNGNAVFRELELGCAQGF